MSAYDHRQQYEHAQGARHDSPYDSARYDASYDEYGAYQDTYARDSYGSDPYPDDSYSRPASARASAAPARAAAAVGSVAAGRARVPAAAPPAPQGSPPEQPDGAPRPRYDWSTGRRGATGRATVPVSPGPAGPASGRATVRPAGAAGGGPGGGAGGNGRPGAPGGRPPGRKRKRHWVRNTLLSFLAMMVMITGGGMVALSYYVESVPPPAELDLEEASTIFYSDGSEMAVLQEVHREIIDTTTPELENVRNAVIAAEDNDFYSHSGVDFVGIVRAAWNNFRGGPRSGASTIDQQYARRAANIYEDSYARKLQEAAMAYKMNQNFEKDQILDFYLNTIYFGRGAHGIQAAAQSYFGKDAAELSVGEAALLAGVIRLPDANDGTGLSPYDPLHNPEDQQIAVDRWYYVLNQMVGTGAISAEERAELTELPEVIDPQVAQNWHEGPQGNIVRQVRRELEAMGFTDLATGGYRITTTIDPEIQEAALDAARRKNKGGHWEGLPDNVTSALVAIDPTTGAVLAYYGGEDGTAFDNAGKNWDEEIGWHGGRPPGSTFKIYTVIAALREGVSLDSHWKTSDYDPGFGPRIRNAGRDARSTGCEGQAPDYCTLRWSVQQSYNVPFFHFAEAVPGQQGAAKIVQAAHDAGIRMMTGTTFDADGNAVRDIRDLTEVEDFSELGRDPFDYHVAFGQYPITVLDHASGVATLAARGVYHEPHFVARVEQRVDGEWQTIGGDRISGERRIQTEHVDALTGVLSTIPAINGVPLEGGRPAAAKTGTWEHASGQGNADAWMVGYTPQIAAAVWVGAEDNSPIFDQFGRPMPSSGLPSQIWKLFMDAAHGAKGHEHIQFPPAPPVGSPHHPYANGEVEEEEREPGDPRCRLPWVSCPDPPDDEDDNDQGEGRGRGGGISPPPGGDPGTEPPDDDG